jgi:polyhydroxybutyrate depolymerase
VLLNFHGGGGNAQGHKDYVQMDALADEKGFLAVYPNGTGPIESRLLTWNAGTCCGFAMENKIDDVEFVRALIDDLGSQVPIDTDRIYATGLSNGGMMAYRLAAEAPDLVKAIAPVAGAMVLEASNLSQPVPVMHFHSIDDPRALYHGGLGPSFPLTDNRVRHNPVEEVIAAWATLNSCGSGPLMGEMLEGEPGTRNEGHTAVKLTYSDCTDGAEVILWKLTGAGHVWPGGTPGYLTRILGPSTDLIDANREMWAFFTELP